MKRRYLLESIEDAEATFGSLVTGRHIRRRDVLRCVDRGLAKSAGMVQLIDGDGFAITPERFAEGFVLTDAGRAFIRTGH